MFRRFHIDNFFLLTYLSIKLLLQGRHWTWQWKGKPPHSNSASLHSPSSFWKPAFSKKWSLIL